MSNQVSPFNKALLRILVFSLSTLGIVSLLVILRATIVVENLSETGNLEQGIEQFRHLLRIILLLFGMSLFLLASWVAYFSRQILIYNQYPPTGTWMLRPIATVHGIDARRRAYLSMAIASLLAGFSIMFPAFAWHTFNTLITP